MTGVGAPTAVLVMPPGATWQATISPVRWPVNLYPGRGVVVGPWAVGLVGARLGRRPCRTGGPEAAWLAQLLHRRHREWPGAGSTCSSVPSTVMKAPAWAGRANRRPMASASLVEVERRASPAETVNEPRRLGPLARLAPRAPARPPAVVVVVEAALSPRRARISRRPPARRAPTRPGRRYAPPARLWGRSVAHRRRVAPPSAHAATVARGAPGSGTAPVADRPRGGRVGGVEAGGPAPVGPHPLVPDHDADQRRPTRVADAPHTMAPVRWSDIGDAPQAEAEVGVVAPPDRSPAPAGPGRAPAGTAPAARRAAGAREGEEPARPAGRPPWVHAEHRLRTGTRPPAGGRAPRRGPSRCAATACRGRSGEGEHRGTEQEPRRDRVGQEADHPGW